MHPRTNLNRQNATTQINLNRQITTVTTTTQPPSKPNPKILSLLLKSLIMTFIITLFFIFIGLAAIIFLNLCLAGGALHRRRNRRRPISESGEIPSGYPSELRIDLPIERYYNYNGVDICAICLEIVENGDFIRVLSNCDHVFHVGCVDKWIVKMPFCPTCRGPVGFSSCDRGGVVGWERLWGSCG